MKENQGLKETENGLDWLVSFIDMYFPCILYALVVKDCLKCCLFYDAVP